MYSQEIDTLLLPTDHPIYDKLEKLCTDPTLFESIEQLENNGFKLENPPQTFRAWSIIVLTHPDLPGYVIKKYLNHPLDKTFELQNYINRIQGARLIAEYIELKNLQHIIVPQKWLYPLPPIFNDPITGQLDYILICEKIDILPGGYWDSAVKYLYGYMSKSIMEELCLVLYDLCGCDAWPQNQPFTTSYQIAFIDTEYLGQTPGDFLFPLLAYINPHLHGEAILLWNTLSNQAPPWILSRIQKNNCMNH